MSRKERPPRASVKLAAASLLMSGCLLIDLSQFDTTGRPYSTPDAGADGPFADDAASDTTSPYDATSALDVGVLESSPIDASALQDQSTIDALSDASPASESSVPTEASFMSDVDDIPTEYKGKPFNGVVAQIPGTIYARNYDTGGQGVAFHDPGPITCRDWPAGMPMYRTGADCVGLSVESAQEGDVSVDGGPADNGEIYLSYCTAGEWLNYTVEVLESGTYSISITDGGPPVEVSFSFSAMPTATTVDVTLPESLDEAMPSHQMYHVWQTVDDVAEIDLQAGLYVMQFTVVNPIANFDAFTFTKM